MESWQLQHEGRGRGRWSGRGRGSYPSTSSSFAQSNKSRPLNISVYAATTKTTTSYNGSGSRNVQDNNDDEGLPNIVGTCPFMCSVEERLQRERLRDLAIFERLDGNPAKSSSALAVKKFCRTIFKNHMQDADLRPLPVLEDTLTYLLSIFHSREHAFEVIHDFVFDRTRSIRQDLGMQNMNGDQAVSIYERIVKFHIISHYKLRTNTRNSEVSPMLYLNTEQLTKALASLYDLYEVNRTSNSTYVSEAEFYSFFVLLHLGSDRQPTGESLSLWFRRLPYYIIKSKETMLARRLLRYFRFGDYKRFLNTTEAEASCLQYYIIEPYISDVRAFGLSCVNSGGYKLNPYPLVDLSKHLLLEESDVESFCRDCGLNTFTNGAGEKFLPTKQTSFSYSNKESRKSYPLVSERLKKFDEEVPLK